MAESSNRKLKVAIAGIRGRMGQASAPAVIGADDMELVAAIGRPGADYVGQEVADLLTLRLGGGTTCSVRVADSLEAAAKFNAGVSAPFVIMSEKEVFENKNEKSKKSKKSRK